MPCLQTGTCGWTGADGTGRFSCPRSAPVTAFSFLCTFVHLKAIVSRFLTLLEQDFLERAIWFWERGAIKGHMQDAGGGERFCLSDELMGYVLSG